MQTQTSSGPSGEFSIKITQKGTCNTLKLSL